MPTASPELKNYQLLDLIGCGGMGYVFAGYDLRNQKPVAVKVLSQECSEIDVVLQRFKMEGKILKGLNHKNIVKYVEAGQENGFHYLAMEYVKGISMDALPLSHSASSLGVQGTIPTMEEYILIFKSCMEALTYIHKQGLVHRDIKPQNIILHGSNYNPSFIDFGIAKFIKENDDLFGTEEKLYTLVYASPEQLTNKPVDYASDLFSFGVVMYEKLTGRLPFIGKREMEVFLAHTKWNFPPPRQLNPDIPQKLEQMILKLLLRDPEQRYPSAEMVQGELEKLLDVLRSAQKGLTMTGIVSEIREVTTPDGVSPRRSSAKKRSLSEEIISMKRARNEYVEAKNKLRLASAKLMTEPQKIEELRSVTESLRQEFERLQTQTKMTLGFKTQPLVIDKFKMIQKMNTLVYEKRGVPFTINTIEQKLTYDDGTDIIVGNFNFSERSKRFYSINHKENFLSWDETN